MQIKETQKSILITIIILSLLLIQLFSLLESLFVLKIPWPYKSGTGFFLRVAYDGLFWTKYVDHCYYIHLTTFGIIFWKVSPMILGWGIGNFGNRKTENSKYFLLMQFLVFTMYFIAFLIYNIISGQGIITKYPLLLRIVLIPFSVIGLGTAINELTLMLLFIAYVIIPFVLFKLGLSLTRFKINKRIIFWILFLLFFNVFLLHEIFMHHDVCY